jgi:hypothetical protein
LHDDRKPKEKALVTPNQEGPVVSFDDWFDLGSAPGAESLTGAPWFVRSYANDQ